VEPGPGQESVWDYPRPPRVEASRRRVRVELGGRVIAESDRALRVCETASPPVYYVPREDVLPGVLEDSDTTTFCEWKGRARYFSARLDGLDGLDGPGGRLVPDVAWGYPRPEPGFEALRDHVAFYPGRVDACWLGEERVAPQAGPFYGGWVTAEIVGPYKGEPGTEGW
jgi:uncharacterized protein (DUF427 family)